MSRRPEFLPVDNVRMPDNRFWWDGNVPSIDTNGNDPTLLALSTLEILNVGDDFLSKLKEAYSSCTVFSSENSERRSRQKIQKSSDGLFRYHNRVVILHPSSA